MSTWYYYDEEGDKIAVTGGQLKGLAKAGRITPETIIETEDGKFASARNVKGLTFATSEVESCGLLQPAVSPEPSPFTASMPVATKPAAENPFTATMPTASRAVPQSVSVPVVEEDEYHNSRSPIRIFVGVGILLFGLVLIGIGISKLGGGGGSGKLDQLKYALRFDGEFMDAVKQNDSTKMYSAMTNFFSMKFPGHSPEFKAIHERHVDAMMTCFSAYETNRTERSTITKAMYESAVQKYIDSSRSFMAAIDEERKRAQGGGTTAGTAPQSGGGNLPPMSPPPQMMPFMPSGGMMAPMMPPPSGGLDPAVRRAIEKEIDAQYDRKR